MVNPRLIFTCLAEICQGCRVECFVSLGIGMDRFDTLFDDLQKRLRQMIDSKHEKLSRLVCGCDC